MKFVVEKVFERDIDLLILEEFASSSAFAALFLQPAGIALPVQMLEAEHSLTESDLGESDLYFLIKTSSGQRVGIFIEDKINAVAMQRQYDRYVQRAQRMQAAGVFEDYRIFIAAPQKYLDANGEAEKYDHKIAYETLI
ncbi:MAG: hypothetical protein IJC61_06795, partial [Oscillospiraceae bacterium]|nr:hypothetical protein [Oscillospiraceae bacterium]